MLSACGPGTSDTASVPLDRTVHMYQSEGSADSTTRGEQRRVHQAPLAGGIHHVGISVADLERSLGFYRDLLGLGLIALSEEEEVGSVAGIAGARARFADLDAGHGQLVELVQYSTCTRGDPQPPNVAGSCHFSLRVQDLESALARLASAGITPLGKSATLTGGVWDGCSVVYVRDPDGMLVELIEQRTDA
jgi:catechol 2,3-dioxygenase-like lactoylglutathione lyase family enzyme